MTEKPLIYDLDIEGLEKLMSVWGQPKYRAGQVFQALYVDLVESFEDITTLPAALRDRLAGQFTISHLEARITLDSSDGQTRKTLFGLPNGEAIEAVLMRYKKRNTLCISTQAGCAMGCVFCATGQMGFRGNLTSGQIAEQVLYYARLLKSEGQRPTNVVIMGMGEPFHNYEATMAAIDLLNHPKGFNLGARRFTVSTVGLIPAIKQFARENRQVNLAISLHATEDEHRESMLPVNKQYPINELIEACREYVRLTSRRITFEWALIRDENDSQEQANRLADLLAGINCHVNVIPLNPTEGYAGQATTRERAQQFREILERRGIPCTVRVRRGIDINAGCGQLAMRGE